MITYIDDEDSGSLMKDIFYKLKTIVRAKRNYEGLQHELTINALLKLITKVLQTANSEICIMAIKSLNFILLTVDREIFEKEKITVYGFILRSLSYRHSDEFVLKVIKLLRAMLENEVYPSYMLNFMYSYIINTLNALKPDSELSLALSAYCHALMKATNTEVQFLKIWKLKVVGDSYYDGKKLEKFMNADSNLNPLFKKMVEQIN